MSKFIVKPDFWALFPQATIAVVLAKGVNNASACPEAEALLESAHKEAGKYLGAAAFAENPAVAEHLGGQHLHGGVLHIGAYIVRFHAGFFQQLKKVDGRFQVFTANALNGEAHRVLARVEHAVLAGAVILEFQQHVAVFQLKYVFCFAFVYFFHCAKSPFPSS